MSANTDIYDRAVDRAATIRLYEERLNGKVSVILDGHRVRVDDLVAAAGTSDKALKQLFRAVDQELSDTFTRVYHVSSDGLLSLAKNQISFTSQSIEKSMGDILRINTPVRRVAEDFVLKNPLIENRTLEEGWAGVSLSERKRLELLIRRGIAEGKTIEDIALDVRNGNLHSITKDQSKALVTTAVTSVTAQADFAVYEANRKVLHGWEYVAVLDKRTTPICSHRDGKIFTIDERQYLPPAHYRCRSTTIPVFKSWADISNLEGLSQIRRRNLANLTPQQIAYYDGQTPMRESYNEWLLRQPTDIQFKHLGDYKKVDLFNTGKLTVDQFTNMEGKSVGINELNRITEKYTLQGDSDRFAVAKTKLDAMQLGINTPDDLIDDIKLQKTLADYYVLQAGELDGVLSLTNYRGQLLHNKRNTKRLVMEKLPRDDQMIFNPITGRYEDVRLYQPNPAVLNRSIRLIDEESSLKDSDKAFIKKFIDDLEMKMGVNQRAVVADNLRIIFTRYRKNPQPWLNFKAVVQSQIKFDVMNISESIETQIRADADILKKLKEDNYIDPVLGPVQLQELHDQFIDNILSKNKWEDSTAPKIARSLRSYFDLKLPLLLRQRISDAEKHKFYLKFAQRLSLADSPDFDQLAMALGRDLYNAAGLNGTRNKWFEVGKNLLESDSAKKFYELETFGVQKRRMKSRMSGQYFGPYYDTLSYNLRITDPRIQEYSKLTRKVELGLRVSVKDLNNRLIVRPGYKTYFIDRGVLGYTDTRIPITSTDSFKEFPEDFIDKDFADALNWAGQTRYRIDEDYYDFIKKLLYFEDDRGNAKKYNELNHYRKYIASRGDSYERFKAMEWLRADGSAFSNTPFIDHRARIYDRGLIGPQSGETFQAS